MVEVAQINQLKRALKRVFSFPITNTTFKELQTAIVVVLKQDRETVNKVLEALLNTDLDKGAAKPFKELAEEFAVPTRIARDVLEKGEFINFMSSDLLRQGNRSLFSNHMRRVDGNSFHFFSEPEGIIRLLEHFTGRLEELKQKDTSKKAIQEHSKEVEALRNRLSNLIS